MKTAVMTRIRNSGQSCIAGKRFFVHADIYDDFTSRFVAAFDALKVDDPMKPDTEVGPSPHLPSATSLLARWNAPSRAVPRA